MRLLEPTHAKNFYATCNQLFSDLLEKEDGRLLLSYVGELSQDLSFALSNRLEELLLAEGVKTSTAKKLFTIFIEALQNARIHGARLQHESVICGMAFLRLGDTFKLYFSNVVGSDQYNEIKSRVEEINQLAPTDLKKLYLETMSEGDLSEKGGAGLGILTMALKSANPIVLSEQPLGGDNTAMTLTVLIQAA